MGVSWAPLSGEFISSGLPARQNTLAQTKAVTITSDAEARFRSIVRMPEKTSTTPAALASLATNEALISPDSLPVYDVEACTAIVRPTPYETRVPQRRGEN